MLHPPPHSAHSAQREEGGGGYQARKREGVVTGPNRKKGGVWKAGKQSWVPGVKRPPTTPKPSLICVNTYFQNFIKKMSLYKLHKKDLKIKKRLKMTSNPVQLWF